MSEGLESPAVNPLAAWLERHPEVTGSALAHVMRVSNTQISDWKTGQKGVDLVTAHRLWEATSQLAPGDGIEVTAWVPYLEARAFSRRAAATQKARKRRAVQRA